MATPKIAMIPTAYKAGKLYSQLPVDGVGDFDVTRSGVSTRVNQSGLIEEVAANTPRLDYSGGGCPSLLTEPSRTNLITYSEDFNVWTKNRVSISANQAISPDGTLNASELIDDANNQTHYISGAFTLAPSDSIISVFAKQNTSRYFNIGSTNNLQKRVVFDLQEGVESTVGTSVSSYGIEDYGNGWYRCWVNVPSSEQGGVFLSNSSTTLGAYEGDGSSIYIWGVQLEEGSFPTSYIPTNGSTETRGAESITGAGDANTINSSEGVLVFEGSFPSEEASTAKYFGLNNGGTTNRVLIYQSTGNNKLRCLVNSNGVNEFLETDLLSGYPTKLTDNLKIALKWKNNDFSIYINGLEIKKQLSGNAPILLSQLSFDNGVGSSPFNGKTKYLAVHDTALTDLQLEAETGFGNYSEMANQLEYTIE